MLVSNDMLALIVIVTVAACGVVALWLRSRHYRRNVIETRNMANPGDIYQEHFAPLGVRREEFLEAWEIVASAFRIDSRQLRATDRFDRELRVLDAWNSGEGVSVLEDQLKSRGLMARSGIHLRSVEDFVRHYCGVRQARVH